jgi:ArsR family transcriptional regulator, arsenate/arsenite/antimonite-responsive transcriptional repressor
MTIAPPPAPAAAPVRMGDDQVAKTLSALGSTARLRLYRLLLRAGKQGLSLTGLQAASGVPLSTLNHHVQTLASVGLIVQTRQGRELICTAAFANIYHLSEFLVAECCRADPTYSDNRAPASENCTDPSTSSDSNPPCSHATLEGQDSNTARHRQAHSA